MSQLPKGWALVPLSDVAEVRLGRQRSPEQATGEHMRPYVRAANVTWSGVNVDDVKEMNFTPKEFVTYELKPGDILLSEASGSASEVGKPAIWRGEITECCFQNTLIRVRSRGPLPEYLHLHFFADARMGRFAAAGKGIGINHLGADRMSSWPTTLPPLEEQRRIVAKLEALQVRGRRAREALDAVPPLLEKLRQSILAAAFRGDLTKDWRAKQKDIEPTTELLKRIRTSRPTHEKWKAKYGEPKPIDRSVWAELPFGWAVVELGEVVTRLTNGFVGPTRDIYVESGIPYLLSKHVKKNVLAFDGNTFVSDEFNQKNRKSILKTGDVLLVQTGHVGASAVVPAEHEGHNCHAMIVITPVQTVLDGNYLSLFFGSPRTQAAFGTLEKGMTLRHLNCHDVIHLETVIPPLAEQREIVRIVQKVLVDVERVLATAVSQEAALSQLDRSLLAKAFRGELVPQDPNDEPAEAMLALARPANGAATTNGTPSKRGRPRAAQRAESSDD